MESKLSEERVAMMLECLNRIRIESRSSSKDRSHATDEPVRQRRATARMKIPTPLGSSKTYPVCLRESQSSWWPRSHPDDPSDLSKGVHVRSAADGSFGWMVCRPDAEWYGDSSSPIQPVVEVSHELGIATFRYEPYLNTSPHVPRVYVASPRRLE